jgi:RNA polymerase sigma factor (sigma-70 family)
MSAHRDRPGRGDDCGAEDGFVVVVREHSAAVHAYLTRRAGRPTADELLGEVWLRAFRSWHNLSPAWASPRPWLYGIARNTLRNHWRLHARLQPPAERADDPWEQVDERLDANRLAPHLAWALTQLSPDDREVLMLVAWEQLAPAEVAVTLEIPQGTARSRLHRARHLLQHYLDTAMPAQPGCRSAEA